jgi:hypothetical protein
MEDVTQLKNMKWKWEAYTVMKQELVNLAPTGIV